MLNPPTYTYTYNRGGGAAALLMHNYEILKSLQMYVCCNSEFDSQKGMYGVSTDHMVCLLS